MFWKRFACLSLTATTLLLASGIPVQAADTVVVDNTAGVVRVNYTVTGAIKVMVTKDATTYTYDLFKTGEAYPLQFGNGKYSVALYQKVQGNQYRMLQKTDVTVALADDLAPFRSSSQIIDWNTAMKAMEKAKSLSTSKLSDLEKAKALHEYITTNVKYDYPKISKLTAGYLPSVESTYASNLGICFDYSALYGAMLRSVGIPAKLVKGYKNDIPEYHAWNQVYLDNKWINVDTTYDAALKGSKVKTQMLKSDTDFRPAKFY